MAGELSFMCKLSELRGGGVLPDTRHRYCGSQCCLALAELTFPVPCTSVELLMLLKSRTSAPRGEQNQLSPSKATSTILQSCRSLGSSQYPLRLLMLGCYKPGAEWSCLANCKTPGATGKSPRRSGFFWKRSDSAQGLCVKWHRPARFSETIYSQMRPLCSVSAHSFPSSLPHTGYNRSLQIFDQ